MHLFIQAACFIVSAAVAAALEDRCADAFLFKSEHLIRENLVQITGEPFDISIHDKTDDIFYIASEDDSLKLFVVKGGSGKPEEIKGLKDVPYAIDIDNDNDDVDFSIGDNLYTYNRDANTAIAHDKDTGKHDPIIQLFYTKNARYASTAENLYKITKGQKIELDSDLYHGDSLVVDSKENAYFIGKDHFPYVTPKGAAKKIKLEIPGVDTKDPALFTMDRKDNVYLILKHNVYGVTADSKTPHLYGDIKVDSTSVTFDKHNNPIMGYKGGIDIVVKIDC